MSPDTDQPTSVSRSLDGPLLRPDQAAVLLAVKTSWVYDAVRTGSLPCVRVGRHIRFTRGMLEECSRTATGHDTRVQARWQGSAVHAARSAA
jgi:excisionase family DNA binding protein